ncbi:MAG: hypothetical protein LBI28_11685 [Treponema sp.]|jgi:hypothetical protein|nr:hypothetical protein [Treponema sp.]
MIAEKTELRGVFQEGIDNKEKKMDSVNELYRLLQEGIDDVENGRTKSMKDSIEYIREKIN